MLDLTEIKHINIDLTVRDVFDTFNEEQKNLLYLIVGKMLDPKVGDKALHLDEDQQKIFESLDDDQQLVFKFMLRCAKEEINNENN